MLRKFALVILCTAITVAAGAQLQAMKLVSKRHKDFMMGGGAFLKFSFPASEADYITLEGGLNIFLEKDYPQYAVFTTPVKLGYRYTVDRSGTGLYVEPQLGYNIVGFEPVYNGYDFDEKKYRGIAGTLHVGYLFQPGNKIQFDLGAFYETIFRNGTPISYAGLRLAHHLTFGQRE